LIVCVVNASAGVPSVNAVPDAIIFANIMKNYGSSGIKGYVIKRKSHACTHTGLCIALVVSA
jgi:hypothetical protein